MNFINIIIKVVGRDSANPKIAKTQRFRHADKRGLQGNWGGLQTACRVLARGLQSACKGCSAFAKAHFQCWVLGIAPGGRVLHATLRTLLHPLSPGLFFCWGSRRNIARTLNTTQNLSIIQEGRHLLILSPPLSTSICNRSGNSRHKFSTL